MLSCRSWCAGTAGGAVAFCNVRLLRVACSLVFALLLPGGPQGFQDGGDEGMSTRLTGPAMTFFPLEELGSEHRLG